MPAGSSKGARLWSRPRAWSTDPPLDCLQQAPNSSPPTAPPRGNQSLFCNTDLAKVLSCVRPFLTTGLLPTSSATYPRMPLFHKLVYFGS